MRVLLTGVVNRQQVKVRETYMQAIEALGHTPVVTPPTFDPALAKKLDALLLTGGGDVNPALYGGKDMGDILFDTQRDELEISLIEAFLQENKPIGGICRGLQVICVALGGTLQNISNHTQVQGKDAAHAIALSKGAHKLLQGLTVVNSAHHQAALDLPKALKAIAHSPDGIIEAVQGKGPKGSPVRAVQWHPERDTNNDAEQNSRVLSFLLGQNEVIKAEHNPHAGHRTRMRKRAITQGFDGFEPHEVLEVMLYGVVPRGNTNPIAHALLRRFGSFSAVLDASPQDLMQVDGVGEQVAIFLKTIPAALRFYEHASFEKKPILSTSGRAARYIAALTRSQNEECFYCLSLDGQFRLNHADLLARGIVNEATVYPRAIVHSALKNNAVHCILAHNHPSGSLISSQADRDFTRHVRQSLESLGIRLLEHLIVTRDRYNVVNEWAETLQKNNGKLKANPHIPQENPEGYSFDENPRGKYQ